MSLRRALSHHLPDRGFDQIGRPLPGKTAFDLFDAGDFSPGPDFLQGGGNFAKGGKRFASGMQEDQVVVATFGKCALSPNPENASLQACKPSCGFRFGEITITSFVILHARLGDERLPVGQSAHRIGQVVMGLVLKHVADGEWRVFWDGQSIGLGKLRANVATRVGGDQWMVFEPHQKAFFKLATERLPDSGARFETRNPSRNGAACYFEQINTFDCRCDHQHFSCESSKGSVPTGSIVSRRAHVIYTFQKQYTRCGAIFPGTFVPVLTLEGKCLRWRAKPAHLGGHLPDNALTHRDAIPQLSPHLGPEL